MICVFIVSSRNIMYTWTKVIGMIQKQLEQFEGK